MTSLPLDMKPGGRFAEWVGEPIRYVVSDLDGTVITDEGKITPAVVDATAALNESKIPIGFATGRLRQGAVDAYHRLSAPGPHMFYNGAEVRAGGVTVASWPLSPDAVDYLSTALVENGAYGEFYTEDGYYYTLFRDGAQQHWNMLGCDPLGEIDHPSEIEGDILKVTSIGFDPEETARLESAFSDSGLEVGSAGAGDTDWRFINVTSPGVNKGLALEAAARHLQVPCESVLAIGDGNNDLSMLGRAGTAVAMGQASEVVKAASHLVAPSIAEDGLAVTLRRLLLE